MQPSVRLLTRYPVSLAIVPAAAAAVAAAFTFARPELEPEPGTEMVNPAEQDYISPAAVRAAFAAEGLPLRYTSGSPRLLVLNSDPPPQTAEKLSVYRLRCGRVSLLSSVATARPG
jgi:hypothetical protein